jgi:serine phosphatase RsbU (regulator of sigma subunit)
MTAADRVAQLTAVIVRQQQELEAFRAQAAAEALVNLAKGTLVERLHCSPGEAATQLTRLAEAAGRPLIELAADVLNQTDQTVQSGSAGTAPNPPRSHRAYLAEAAMAMADDGAQVAAAVLEEALAPIGAVAVALWTTAPDGALELAGEAGFGALEASRWQRIPPQMDCLAQRTAQQGHPGWLAGTPSPTDTTARMGRWRGARAVLPLVNGGTLTGVMEICWPTPLARFAPALRHELLALADTCARTLADRKDHTSYSRAAWLPALLGGLHESILLTHAVRDEEGRVTDFHIDHANEGFVDPAGRGRPHPTGRRLLQLYPLMAAPGGLFSHALDVLRTGQPYHSSGLGTRALVGDSALAATMDVRIARLFDGVAITWLLRGEADRLASLLEHTEKLGHLGAWQEDVITGDVRWTEHTFALFHLPPTAAPISLAGLVDHAYRDDIEDVANFRHTLVNLHQPAAVAFRLVRSDGAIRHLRALAEPVTDRDGMLVAVRGAYQDLSARYHTQLALDATRDQLADSEQRAEEQRRLALQLQQAIVPSTDQWVDVTGLDVAVRYRPAQHLVGGDWYDTVVLPSKEVLLVVGDIAGHGIDAVTGMVMFRNSLRGLAMTGAGPGQLLSWLNSVAYHLTDNVTATVVCGLYKPTTRTLTWARAGHLPPVLVRGGVARALPAPSGVLLGALADTTYDETSTSLKPGDGLLLFTDGLVERRGASLDEALNALLEVAGEPTSGVQAHAEYILRRTRSDTDDDICLIVLHLR